MIQPNQLSNHPTNQPSSQRSRTWRIILVITTLVLACCLCASLTANVGTGGWAYWNQWQLQHEQARTAALESQVQRLQQVLQENGLELPLNPADAQLMDTIAGQVVTLRGLQPEHPVERALITQGQLHDKILQDFEENYSPQEAQDYALTLAAFDFLDPSLDMYDLLLRLYTEQIAGFYDPEVEQIYVIADTGLMGQVERLTYAHEFTHALQDQYFDLQALGLRDNADEEYDSEYLSAIQALTEGDASLVQQQFLGTYYSAGDMATLMQESLEIDTAVLDSAPDVLQQGLYFPYRQGQVFVEALYEEGGWDAVDAAYANPPRSTEQILHPDRYRAGDAPQIVSLPPLTDTLGFGWQVVDADIIGEFGTRLYLAQQIPEDEAETAAEGWGGDGYAVHYREADSALVMVLHTVWDTPTDAEEFVDAYVGYAEGRFGHSASVSDGARQCWAGDSAYLCLTWGPSDTAIVLGPDEATVEAVSALLAERGAVAAPLP